MDSHTWEIYAHRPEFGPWRGLYLLICVVLDKRQWEGFN